jgi:hypothetical protein
LREFFSNSFVLSEDPKSKKPKPNILPFAKKFLEAVDEIADRLGIKSLGTPLETVVGPSAIGSSGYSHGAAPPKAGSASGSWGLSSVLSSQSLKDFIDGPQQQAQQQQQHGPPAAPGVSAHTMMGAPGAQDMFPAHQPQQQLQQQNRPKSQPATRYHVPPSFAQPAAPAPAPVPVHSSPTHQNMPPTNAAQRPMSTPVVSSSGLPPMPFKVPPQQQQQQQQQSTGFPPQPPGMAQHQQPPPQQQQQQYPPQQNSHNPNNLMVDVDLGAGDDFQQNQQYQQQQYPPYQQQQAQPPQQQQQRPNPNQQQQPAVQRWNPASAAAAPNPNMGPGPTSGGPNAYPNNNGMNNPSAKVAAAPWSMNPAMNPQQQQQQMQQPQNQQQPNQFQQSTQQQPQQMQQQQQAPTSQEGSSRGPVNQASPSNAAKTAAANNNNNNSNLNAPTSGLLGSLRKGMIGWLYPDAKDASSNIGTSLEAFYDEKLGRWVFPGEVS